MKTLIILSWLCMLAHGWNDTTLGMADDPGFVTNDPVNYRQVDTTFYDITPTFISGVYKARTVVGDSSYARLDLSSFVTLDRSSNFHLTAKVYVDKLSIYSMIFFGVTDESAAVPYKGSPNSAIMVGLGRAYDGPLFGVYASSGARWFQSSDTVRSGLLAARKSYLLSLVSSNGHLAAELRDASTKALLMARSLMVNWTDLYDRGLYYLTVGTKGYTSENGNGVADFRLFVDSVWFQADGVSMVSESPVIKPAAPGIRVLPNPCLSQADIRVDGLSAIELGQSLISLLDIRGRTLLTFNSGLFQARGAFFSLKQDVSRFPAGVYLLRLESDRKRLSTPVFIKK